MSTPIVGAVGAASLFASPPASGADQEFDSDGVRLGYVVAGEGAPVVLLHGITLLVEHPRRVRSVALLATGGVRGPGDLEPSLGLAASLEAGQGITAVMPALEVRTIPGADHVGLLREPQLVAVMHEFLAANSGAAPVAAD